VSRTNSLSNRFIFVQQCKIPQTCEKSLAKLLKTNIKTDIFNVNIFTDAGNQDFSWSDWIVQFSKFWHKSRNRELDSRNLVLRSSVNISLASEPSPKPSTNRFYFSTWCLVLLQLAYFFSIADARKCKLYV